MFAILFIKLQYNRLSYTVVRCLQNCTFLFYLWLFLYKLLKLHKISTINVKTRTNNQSVSLEILHFFVMVR